MLNVKVVTKTAGIRRIVILSALLAALVLPSAADAATASDYLPLAVGQRWVLRHPNSRTAVTIEVQKADGDVYRIRFTNPWGANDWDLEQRGGQIFMTGFGRDGQLASMPANTVFFDFSASAGASWSNQIGKMTVLSKNLTVQAGGVTYSNCIQIRQSSHGSNIVYAFAPGIGFVQFGDTKTAFTLDVGESALPNGANTSTNDNRPQPRSNNSTPVVTRAGVLNDNRLHIGVTVNTFANEPFTPETLLSRFDQTVNLGIGYLNSAQKWTELEPSNGQFNFGGLDFQVQASERLNIPMSCTLRVIDTVDRVVPNDLKHKSWTDRKVQDRVLALIDAMIPHFHGRVKWFMFGNEIDGYFARHPKEIGDYAELHKRVAAHLKEKVPGIRVGATLQFAGIDALNGSLKPLNEQFDFLAFTYYPFNSDFTMRSPDSPSKDFARMRQVAAGRKVVLQEIGYSSSELNGSSQDKQAEFYKAAFQALRQNRDFIEASNFFLLADLSDKFTKDMAGF